MPSHCSAFTRPLSALLLPTLVSALLLCCGACSERPESTRLSEPPPIGPDEGVFELNWKDAEKAVGKVAYVSGKVIDTGFAGKVHFINFDEKRPARFTGIVFDELVESGRLFPPDYKGRLVRIRGRITTYRDRPQIVINDPEQIEVVDRLPQTTAPLDRSIPTGDEITVATFNILNLFDAVDDPYHADESTTPKPREQLERVAAVLRKLDADVVGLQEVESRGYLQRFVDVFCPDLGYQVVHFEGNDVRGIDVCLLTRLPVGTVSSHRHIELPGPADRPRRFSRDLLTVTLRPPEGEPFEVWGVHLKSNSGGAEHAEPVRLAEAAEIRRLLDKRLAEDANVRIVLLGDFNDTWQSKTLHTIVGEGDTALACPWSDAQAEGDPITYNKAPYESMIDFILLSPAMKTAYVRDSYSIRAGSVDETGSDHNPVSLRLLLRAVSQ